MKRSGIVVAVADFIVVVVVCRLSYVVAHRTNVSVHTFSFGCATSLLTATATPPTKTGDNDMVV